VEITAMRIVGLSRAALGISIAAALLAGCGGSQPPIGAPGSMPQSRAIATHAAHGKSWMLPEAEREPLLYVSAYANHVYVYSYKTLKPVGKLGFADRLEGICADARGNIWVPLFDPASGLAKVVKYAHGRTKRLRTLSDGESYPYGCAVDPKTGNLAVSNFCTDYLGGTCNGSGNVAVYFQAQGTATNYQDSEMGYYNFCAYDNSGNLFVVGSGHSSPFNVAELPSGEGSFANIDVPSGPGWPAGVQWHGSDLVIDSGSALYRYTVKGSKTHQIGIISLSDSSYVLQFYVHNKRVIVPGFSTNNVAVYAYPGGGSAVESISVQEPLSVAFSK
jgi:hypothetical protein